MTEQNRHTLVFATNNLNKLKEVQSLLPPNLTILSLKDINCNEDIPETESTIEGNAKLKAAYITKKYGYDCFADDTGLIVPALTGEPGVYSARYAGEEATSDNNIDKLLENLKDKQNRTAKFKTVIALRFNNSEILFEGICNGLITKERRGEKGFGYDPVFLPDGKNNTFAQMSLKEKSEIGHRGNAMRQLIAYLSNVV